VFTKKHEVKLSPESLEALHALNGELSALHEMVGGIVDSVALIRALVEGDVKVVLDDENVDVHPFADPKAEDDLAKQKKARPRKALPEQMTRKPKKEMMSTVSDEDRIRTAPFNRAPRHVVVSWMLDVMADGGWYSNLWFADTYANEPSQHRYLKTTLQHRLREMHEEGLLERRSSHSKGAMFEYRVRDAVSKRTADEEVDKR